jgi:hypothetical protein
MARLTLLISASWTIVPSTVIEVPFLWPPATV